MEQEGTYPLPEAQLDRFLMEVDVPYPDLEAERRMLFATTGAEEVARQVMTADAEGPAPGAPHAGWRRVVEAILEIVRRRVPARWRRVINKNVGWGPGPRASQALMLARAPGRCCDGRLAPRSTTCWRWPGRCSVTAWRSISPPVPKARPSSA